MIFIAMKWVAARGAWCMQLQGVSNNYETDLILPIVNKAAQLAGLEYASANPRQQTALKVIGDHIRAVTYLVSDGVLPSNVGRGYIVRRLLRRVVVKVRRSQYCFRLSTMGRQASSCAGICWENRGRTRVIKDFGWPVTERKACCALAGAAARDRRCLHPGGGGSGGGAVRRVRPRRRRQRGPHLRCPGTGGAAVSDHPRRRREAAG